MIIILEPEKDNYVTNIKTIKNDGSKANTGQAATLDLFKLYNENKHAKSWAAFKFTGAINNGSTLTLIDSNNITKTFEFDTDADPGSVTAGNIRVNIAGQNSTAYASILKATINAVSNFEINADSNSNNELILKQNKAGSSGDTTFTIPTNMVHVGTSATSTITKFARVDYSTLLLKFDLNAFKSNWITLINDTNNDGIDEDGGVKNDLPGAFRNLKAELILKDVTTGISKPKDYTLKIYKLLKDFEEGTGKDTVHFADKGFTDFNNFSSNVEWDVSDFVSTSDATDLTSSFSVVKGDEDLKFDITDYVKSELVKDTLDDKGFLIKFDDTNIYDSKSYFAKRLGSRHLVNKKLTPELRITINDASYNIPVDSFNKKRYLNNVEDFYLFNLTSGTLSNFSVPSTGSYTLKLKIKSKDNKKIYATITANSTSSNPIVNFKGKKLSGIRKAQLTNTSLSKFNSEVSSHIKDGKLEANYEWCWYKESDTSKLVTAGNFVPGRSYKTNTTGTTDFTTIGASVNDNNIIFVASGVGTGSGTAFEIEKSIISNRVDFYTTEGVNESKYENLVTSIKVNENIITANNSMSSIEVYFSDTKKEFNAVKLPYELPSENLGDVYYQVYDVESGKVLIDFDDTSGANGTLMFYDGEKYKFNFFTPKIFKDIRINFKFKYRSNISDTDQIIFNNKHSIKVL